MVEKLPAQTEGEEMFLSSVNLNRYLNSRDSFCDNKRINPHRHDRDIVIDLLKE